MVRWIAVLPCLLLTLAGCSSSDDTPETPDVPPAGATDPNAPPVDSSDPGNGTPPTTPPPGTTPPPPGNEPPPAPGTPEALLAADVLEGPVALTVQFTLNASDPEGDELSWAFDADRDGTNEADQETDGTLPVTLDFTYNVAGTFAPMLVVTDGEHEDNMTLTITVSALVPGTPETWYLHREGTCGTLDPATVYMDKADTEGDVDTCGALDNAGAATGETLLATFPARVPTGGYPSGATVTAKIVVSYGAPGDTTVRFALASGGTEVGSGSDSATVVAVWGGLVPGTQTYEVTFDTTADIPGGMGLEARLYQSGNPSWYLHTEGTDASSFSIA